ncbi:hypothetical protein JCGZ_23310 [Jatropha curcas]|uniref:Uncharacterized protein n=1 Tax=Jatropha curcas TaxID=180498 RepID=A0A067JHX4_JATCU|nr:uncharacterized protein LOC105647502 [Jatropha curcas]XP_012089010.1 uncharacterized protein LOC105647502 [Jatropha curcas]XP_020540320.1 uncharacterized protein LOC105647502 [Jatropha curcas]KDP23477.1 hypothetical protein JCGZ_23310 [Jatropha curcas]
MGNTSLPLRFAVFLSFSLTASSSSQFFSKPQSQSTSSSSSPPNPIPKATPSDLLSVLGPTTQSSKINPLVSRQLRSCFKFLVPFTPLHPKPHSLRPYVQRRLTSERIIQFRSRREENELIWWPPEPVLELARLAFDSGGDVDAIHRALDPTVLPVPDVEGCKRVKCELTRTPYGRRFISEELNLYLKFLFEMIAARGPSIGLNVSLNRYDFFHGHLFIAADTGRLGILFHAKEYPAYDKHTFPFNMGYCQIDSSVTYDDSMNLRNILWLAPFPSNSSRAWKSPGVLVVLDAHPGGIIYRDLIPEYVRFVRTIYEDDLGDVAVDVNYLNVGESVPNYQIFMC